MDRTSSSSSSMSSASMDDSEREGYGYLGVDEEPEEEEEEDTHDYDEMPDDDDDDDDDDMDEDDEDDEEDDAIFIADNVLPSSRFRHEAIPFFRSFTSSANGLHLEHFLTDSPVFTFPSRTTTLVPTSDDRGSYPSVFLDAWENLPRADIARLATHLGDGSRLPSEALSHISSRLRGGLSAILEPRISISTDPTRISPSSVHPMLCRPPVAPPLDATDRARSLISALQRNPSFAERIGIAAGRQSQDCPSTDPRLAFADALLLVQRAYNAVGGDGDASNAPGPVAAPGGEASSMDSDSSADFAAAAQELNQDAESLAGRLRAASLDRAREGRAEGGQDAGPLSELAELGLMRSVEPLGFSSSAELLSGLMSRNRSPYERLASREREREKVPSGILKRWVYDPPSCGGDSLPAIFDDEVAHRAGRNSGRATAATAAMPLIAPETYESVNQLSTKVIDRLDSLVMNLAKIDDKVAEQEMKEQMRKEAEENKKKKKKRKKADVDSEDDGNVEEEHKASKGNHDEHEEIVENPSTDAPAEPPTTDHAISVVDEDNAEENVGTEEAALDVVGGSGTGVQAAQSLPVEDQSDIAMNAVEEDQQETRQLGAGDTGRRAELDGRGQEGAASISGGETEVPRNGFSAVAAQRAAAAGISLEAPANENPEVVAAATESTGIDPAFIAALPDDMRAEILNQYYEQIHTNSVGQAGASQSAAATTVNQDFLVALPPALRAEVLELEAEFQSRQQTASGNNGGSASRPNDDSGAGPGGAAEMDNATFLATLAPELREEILLTSGEAFIQSLPPSVAAEARVLREREASSRLPWRVNADFSVGFDDRRFPNRLRDIRPGQGRQGVRNLPRELPVYRWKKLDKGWLREVPKVEDEPSPVLELDGLSSILKMFWLRQGHYGKTCLYQVLHHTCKSTQSRLLVLKELINLITNNSSPTHGDRSSQSKNGSEIDRSRLHGTVVRRALELLILLCKNDSVVAETLLGLPRNEEEVAKIPEEITEHIVLPQRRSDISLSTLVSLLDAPLFVRSNSHLEQLVSLISTLCLVIPASLSEGSDPKNDNSLASRRRRMVDRTAFNPELEDPMSFLLEPDDEPQPIFQVPGDDDDDSIDDDLESAPGRGSADRAPGSRGGRGTTNTGNEDGNSSKEIVILPQYRIPGFRNNDLMALTKVLLRQGCSERTYERVSRSIGILGELVPVRLVFVDSLVKMAVSTGQEVHKEYEKVIVALERSTKSQPPKQKRSIISAFSAASVGSELMLLRVVKSLSALWSYEAEENSPKKTEESSEENEEAKGTRPKSSTERRFRPSMFNGLQQLWNALDRLLELVSDETGLKKSKATEGRRPPLPAAANAMNLDRIRSVNRSLSPILGRLSPLIEAFLVTHSADESQLSELQPPSPGTPNLLTESREAVQSPLSASPSNGKFTVIDDVMVSRGMETQLSSFVEKHRGPINAILRANPPLLESSFKGALKHPHAIDFDNKKAYFRNIIRKRSSEVHAGTIRINVRRDRVFDDSYQQLRLRTPNEMKGRLHVQFTGEEGVDAGGVTREWYIILARQIFDPNYVLFTRSAAKSATYQPDKRSYINREHLENFRFVGRIIGKAIYDGQLLDAYFTRSFYKHILGLKPTYHDIEAEDPEYYKSLKWMLENDITGILDYTMSAEYDEFGKTTVTDLMPNGRDIPVTEENKAEYVRLVTEVRMTKSIEKQIAAFKEGFYELIPLEDCKIFNELELELLMSGLPDIDMADLKANVEYTGYTASSPQINWFWRCVSKMNQEDLARLVMFVTGTSKVPLEGFSNLQGMNGLQKFQIHRVAGNTMRLPSAHTCFNQLDLPEYSTAEILSERLLRAVRECSVGFGFA